MARKYLLINGPLNTLAAIVLPADFNPFDNAVHCIGGGASGANRNPVPGAGGGGYSRTDNVLLNPGTSVQYLVGRGGFGVNGINAGGDGTDTFFGAATYGASLCGAIGGKKANLVTDIGGAGGDAASGIGDFKTSGGKGGDSTAATPASGGAGGPNGDGLPAENFGDLYGGDGDDGFGGLGGNKPPSGTSMGKPGLEFTATQRWNGVTLVSGSFPFGSGGGSALPSGPTGETGGLYGGGGGPSNTAMSLSGAGGQGGILLEWEPWSDSQVMEF